MPNDIEALILDHLRALRGGQTRIEHELRELQLRLRGLEVAVLGNKREVVYTQDEVARQQASIDAIKDRLLRIEHRLDLTDEIA